MKVLLVNGSPKANGNTARALAEVAEQLNVEGIDTEMFQLGAKPIRDCIGCGQCGKLGGRCTFDDDVVNELPPNRPTALSLARLSTTRTPAAAFSRHSIAHSMPVAKLLHTSRALPPPSPVAAVRRRPSTCSISTSPSTRCLW